MIQISVQWDTAGLTSFDNYLGTHEGVQLHKIIDKAIGKEVKTMVPPLRAAELASGIHNRSRRHYRSIKARKPRLRAGEVTAWTVGPSGPVAHLLVDGHRIVTPGGRDTGNRTRAFPYPEGVFDRYGPAIAERVSSEVWAEQFRV